MSRGSENPQIQYLRPPINPSDGEQSRGLIVEVSLLVVDLGGEEDRPLSHLPHAWELPIEGPRVNPENVISLYPLEGRSL